MSLLGSGWKGSLLLFGLMLLGLWAWFRSMVQDSQFRSASVVVYCAQDQVFAEPVLADFTRETGIRVRSVFDSEAVKTVGLANRLIAEKALPVCDVFWGNEELRTRQLAARGVFGNNRLRDVGDQGWASFGRRTRRLVLDPKRLQPSEAPQSLIELTNARWAGKVSMASPLFGTTATHLLVLRSEWGEEIWENWCRALIANRPFLEEGNAHVVRRVGRGEALIGWTDSDDIQAGLREGYSLQGLEIARDMLWMPNTVGAVKPMNPGGAADLLIEYLRMPEVARRLVSVGALESETMPGSSAQAREARRNDPADRVGNSVQAASRTDWLEPDWDRILEDLDAGMNAIQSLFQP